MGISYLGYIARCSRPHQALFLLDSSDRPWFRFALPPRRLRPKRAKAQAPLPGGDENTHVEIPTSITHLNTGFQRAPCKDQAGPKLPVRNHLRYIRGSGSRMGEESPPPRPIQPSRNAEAQRPVYVRYRGDRKLELAARETLSLKGYII